MVKPIESRFRLVLVAVDDGLGRFTMPRTGAEAAGRQQALYAEKTRRLP